jgi:amino acid transporter, AAT family
MIEEREKLSRQLSSPQLAMIGIGGAIGTGLFLGSALAVHTAGPGVILTYLLGAGIALLLVRALGEMAVAHPTAGSFGVYAETYLNKWAGFTVRYTYWAGQCVAIGGEAAAIAIYCQWWFPHTPQWIWILAFTIGLLYVNARSVGSFGSFEYWFAMIKVIAIVLFIVMGAALILGLGPRPAIGFSNLTAGGGFIANGWRGVWMAIVFVIFSYIGTEVIAVTAGEAKNPELALPRAVRSMAARLILFYLGAIFVLITIVPWTQVQPGAGVTASEPVCPGLRAGWDSRRGAYRQFCGHHGGCFQHELQSLPGQPHDVFIVPWRLCSRILGTRLVQGNARPRIVGFRRRTRPGFAYISALSGKRVRLFIRHFAVRRPVCVAHHLCDAYRLSQSR